MPAKRNNKKGNRGGDSDEEEVNVKANKPVVEEDEGRKGGKGKKNAKGKRGGDSDDEGNVYKDMGDEDEDTGKKGNAKGGKGKKNNTKGKRAGDSDEEDTPSVAEDQPTGKKGAKGGKNNAKGNKGGDNNDEDNAYGAVGDEDEEQESGKKGGAKGGKNNAKGKKGGNVEDDEDNNTKGGAKKNAKGKRGGDSDEEEENNKKGGKGGKGKNAKGKRGDESDEEDAKKPTNDQADGKKQSRKEKLQAKRDAKKGQKGKADSDDEEEPAAPQKQEDEEEEVVGMVKKANNNKKNKKAKGKKFDDDEEDEKPAPKKPADEEEVIGMVKKANKGKPKKGAAQKYVEEQEEEEVEEEAEAVEAEQEEVEEVEEPKPAKGKEPKGKKGQKKVEEDKPAPKKPADEDEEEVVGMVKKNKGKSKKKAQKFIEEQEEEEAVEEEVVEEVVEVEEEPVKAGKKKGDKKGAAPAPVPEPEPVEEEAPSKGKKKGKKAQQQQEEEPEPTPVPEPVVEEEPKKGKKSKKGAKEDVDSELASEVAALSVKESSSSKKDKKKDKKADKDVVEVTQAVEALSVDDDQSSKKKKKKGKGAAPVEEVPEAVEEVAEEEQQQPKQEEEEVKDEGPKMTRKERMKLKKEMKGKPKVEEVKVEVEEELDEYEKYLKAQGMKGKEPPAFVHLSTTATERSKTGNDIKADNITITVPGRTLLQNSSFTLVWGGRYGLIGRNGLGKSTLLGKIADRDGVPVPKHFKILYVQQEVPGDETTAIQYVLKADAEREWLLQEEKELNRLDVEHPDWMDDPKEKRAYSLKDVYDRLREIESDKAEPRASAILVGLGFDANEIKTKHSSDYSGGWRMRIALARALFSRPDLLLLDEPTNHLDLHACFWLERYLSTWKKTLIVVSHEATFLNEVVDHIILLKEKTLTTYKGDYWHYVKAEATKVRANTKKKNTEEKKIAKLQEQAKGGKGTNQKAAKQKKNELEKVKEQQVKVERDDKELVVDFPDPDFIAPPLLRFCEASFGYDPKKPLFKRLDFGIDMDDKIALVGLNGVGKSTLMKLLAGELKETSGYVERSRKIRVARFSQHHLEQLDASVPAVAYFQQKFTNAGSVHEVRQHLGRFGITGSLATNPIETLSGGQKSRVVLAELAWARPHILLLDEPSNHLDIDAIEALAEGLNNFKGGVVLISHNQRLISLVCNQILVVTKGGTVERFNGEFDDYKDTILEQMDWGEEEEEEK